MSTRGPRDGLKKEAKASQVCHLVVVKILNFTVQSRTVKLVVVFPKQQLNKVT